MPLLLSYFSRDFSPDSMRSHRQQPTRLPRPWDSPGKNTGLGCDFLLQCMKVKSETKSLSRVRLLATPWTAAYQAPLSMGFSRQEYWSGVPSSSPLLSIKTPGSLFTKHRETHRLKEQTYGRQGEGWEEGIVRECGMDMYTLLYLKWITNKELLYCTGNSAPRHVAAWMGGKFERGWIRVYVWPSPFTVHLKLSQHC